MERPESCSMGQAYPLPDSLEKHKSGRKLLMCGNSRCNLTINLPPERMLQMYGEPVGPFLREAIDAFPPAALQRWFASNGLKTVVRTGNKVYPHTDRASDVLHFFTDYFLFGSLIPMTVRKKPVLSMGIVS